MVAWLLLFAAIAVEVVSTAFLPRSDGFREPLWTGVVLGGYAFSFWLLARTPLAAPAVASSTA